MSGKRHLWLWYSCVLLTSIGLLELGLRLFFGLGNPILVQADPEIGYRFQPNQHKVRFGKTIAINQFSQRSAPISPTKPAQTLRILMTGDSILNGGTPIEQSQTITSLLEMQLRRAGQQTEVLNASAGSWGIGNQLAYLRKFGFFDSDVLIIEIGDNDLLQPTSTSYRVGRSPYYPDRQPLSAIQELVNRYLWPRLAEQLNIAPPPSEIPIAINPAAQSVLNQQDLQSIIALARSQNIPVFVILVPQRYNLIPKVQVSTYKLDFLKTLKNLNIPIIDIQSIWSTLPNEVIKTYFRDTDHLTEIGNQAISSLIFQKICVKYQLKSCISKQSL